MSDKNIRIWGKKLKKVKPDIDLNTELARFDADTLFEDEWAASELGGMFGFKQGCEDGTSDAWEAEKIDYQSFETKSGEDVIGKFCPPENVSEGFRDAFDEAFLEHYEQGYRQSYEEVMLQREDEYVDWGVRKPETCESCPVQGDLCGSCGLSDYWERI